MKSLVIYYTRTGTTRMIAEEIASEIGADIEEIVDKKKRSGFLGWFASGRDGLKRKLTKIKPIESKIEEYGAIIIGTPVWAGNMAPSVRTFLTENILKNKKAALFCTMRSNNPSKTFHDMRKIIKAKVIAEIGFSWKDIKNRMYKQKLKEFIDNI